MPIISFTLDSNKLWRRSPVMTRGMLEITSLVIKEKLILLLLKKSLFIFLDNKIPTARKDAKLIKISNVKELSLIPKICANIPMCALLLIGKGSVNPWIAPSKKYLTIYN